MQNIKIEIRAKQARALGSPVIVCGNTDYSMTFDFDEEWAEARVKTVRFAYAQGAEVKYQDIVFEGDTIGVPQLSNVREVRVGVFSGDLRTTTAAWIACEPSILCGSGVPEEPSEDVYNQIMALLNEIIKGGGSGGGPGEPGAPGASAYEIAKAHGFEGTEEEWLASLEGKPGETGPAGPQGERGEPGHAGPQGERGETGPAGPQGAAGADGKTPVKGEDYYTEADKAEIIDGVLAALPKYNGEVMTV